MPLAGRRERLAGPLTDGARDGDPRRLLPQMRKLSLGRLGKLFAALAAPRVGMIHPILRSSRLEIKS
jgi:hypothetical protein